MDKWIDTAVGVVIGIFVKELYGWAVAIYLELRFQYGFWRSKKLSDKISKKNYILREETSKERQKREYSKKWRWKKTWERIRDRKQKRE